MLKLISYVCAPMNNKLMLLCRRVGRFSAQGGIFVFDLLQDIIDLPTYFCVHTKTERTNEGTDTVFELRCQRSSFQREALILCCRQRQGCRCRRWNCRRHRRWRVLCTIIALKINPLARPFDTEAIGTFGGEMREIGKSYSIRWNTNDCVVGMD